MATGREGVGRKDAWIEYLEQISFWEEGEGKGEVFKYREHVAASGRSLRQEGQNDGVCLTRLEEMTVRVAEAARSILSRYGDSVGGVVESAFIAYTIYGPTAKK